MTTKTLTDTQLRTLFDKASEGDEIAQFFIYRIRKMDFMKEQFERVIGDSKKYWEAD